MVYCTSNKSRREDSYLLYSYFIARFTPAKDANRPEDVYNTQNVLADIEIWDNIVLDELHKLRQKSAVPYGISTQGYSELSKIIFKYFQTVIRTQRNTRGLKAK